MEIVGNLIEAGESIKEMAKRIIVRDRSSRPILCFIYFAAIVCSDRIYWSVNVIKELFDWLSAVAGTNETAPGGRIWSRLPVERV